MQISSNVFKAAIAVPCLAIAACSGSSNAPSAASSEAPAASIKAAASATPSLSGTTVPSATQIIDSSGNVFTVAGGVAYENGALASYTKNVALLLYDNANVYQENTAGGWWVWSAGRWMQKSDPRKTPSTAGTAIPAATQITDSSGNVWVLSGGVIYENGTLAGYSKGVTALVYDNNLVYQENASNNWWSWSGGTWTSSTDPVSVAGTPTISGSPATADVVGEAYSFVPTTTNPGGGVLSFAIANMPAWAKFSTVSGALTGSPTNAQAGAYANIDISVSSGGLSASMAAFSITVSEGSASLSWTAPTENTNGTALTDLAGYTISYGTSPSDMSQTVQVATSSATSYVVGNLSSGTYYFTIAANATDGTHSVESAEGSKVIL
jgi:hypothetical protein